MITLLQQFEFLVEDYARVENMTRKMKICQKYDILLESRKFDSNIQNSARNWKRLLKKAKFGSKLEKVTQKCKTWIDILEFGCKEINFIINLKIWL